MGEIIAYSGIALVSFVLGWYAKRINHETDGEAATARREGFNRGAETGRQEGMDMLAANLADVCDENQIVHTGEDPKTKKERPYSLRELVNGAEERANGE